MSENVGETAPKARTLKPGNTKSQVGDAVELAGLLGVILGVLVGFATGVWTMVLGAILVLVLAQLIHIRWTLTNRN